MNVTEALAQLEALGDAAKAEGAAAYHKVARRYLGVTVPQITELANGWRAGLDVGNAIRCGARPGTLLPLARAHPFTRP